MTRLFNKNLKFIRNLKKISQQDLANKVNVDRSTISRWENDEMDVTLDNAIKLAEVLDIPFQELLNNDFANSNEYDNKIKELETKTGVKISYASSKELTEEDYIAINELVLNEINSNK